MAAASEKVIQLRQLLAERFGTSALPSEAVFATGLSALDEIGLPQGAITEIVSSSAAPGGGLLLYGLLHALAEKGERVALIDGTASFQPQNLAQPDLRRLLWSRCRNAKEALQAVDLAVRDGNFSVVILLLLLNSKEELRRIPATAWHRLHMLTEKSAAALLAFTPRAQVGSTRLRIEVEGSFPLGDLHIARSELLPVLHLRVERRRVGRQERYEDESVCRTVCA